MTGLQAMLCSNLYLFGYIKGDALGISIRNAESNDIEGIMLIEHESFHENIFESRAIFLERIEAFPEGVLILEVDGEIAGYISSEIWDCSQKIDTEKFRLNHTITDVHTATGSHLYISSIGLLEKHRRKGYGEMLFSELASRMACKYKITGMVLIVSENWHAARKIYQKSGFKEVQRISGFFDDENNSDAIVMEKQL